MPGLTNLFMNSRSVRHILAKMFGLSGQRSMSEFTNERFDRWFAKHKSQSTPNRGSVILWDDTFVRYHEPHIGKAAVAVLEAAGFSVTLADKR